MGTLADHRNKYVKLMHTLLILLTPSTQAGLPLLNTVDDINALNEKQLNLYLFHYDVRPRPRNATRAEKLGRLRNFIGCTVVQ